MCRKWQARGCLDIPGGSRGLNRKALRNCGPQRTPVGPYPPVSSISLLLPPEAESPPLCPSTCPPGTSVLTSHVPGDPSARLHIVPGVLRGCRQWSLAPQGPHRGSLGTLPWQMGFPRATGAPRPRALLFPPPAGSGPCFAICLLQCSWPRDHCSTVLFPLRHFAPHTGSHWPLLSPRPCSELSSGSPEGKATP